MSSFWPLTLFSEPFINGLLSPSRITAWAQDDRRMNDYHASLRKSEMSGKPVVSSVYQGFSGLRLPPPPAPSQTRGMDLVAEFDAGMKQVEGWPSEG